MFSSFKFFQVEWKYWAYFLTLHPVYHCIDSKQHCPCASARHLSSQVQNRHQNRPSDASDEIRHDKSPCVYLQHVCITLSAVLRFSSSCDMSYGTLSETTLLGFIIVAYNSEPRNIRMERIEEKGGKKLIHFAIHWDRSIWMKDSGKTVAKK